MAAENARFSIVWLVFGRAPQDPKTQVRNHTKTGFKGQRKRARFRVFFPQFSAHFWGYRTLPANGQRARKGPMILAVFPMSFRSADRWPGGGPLAPVGQRGEILGRSFAPIVSGPMCCRTLARLGLEPPHGQAGNRGCNWATTDCCEPGRNREGCLLHDLRREYSPNPRLHAFGTSVVRPTQVGY